MSGETSATPQPEEEPSEEALRRLQGEAEDTVAARLRVERQTQTVQGGNAFLRGAKKVVSALGTIVAIVVLADKAGKRHPNNRTPYHYH